MVKQVQSGMRDCTVSLDGSECEVKFSVPYRVFSVMNGTDGDVTMSVFGGKNAGDDGVRTVPAGSSGMIAHMRTDIDTLYVSGTGTVQISAGNEAVNPFQVKGGGGGGDGSYTGITYGTEDLQEGVSPLATGEVYIVYE